MKIKTQYHKKNTIYTKYIKRILDILLSLLAIIILAPLLIIVVLLIKIDSKGPVFFSQERPGKEMKLFKVYKFRTMVQNAVQYQQVGVEVRGNDSRITTLGKVLRRFKIDELAQLFNILKGDMSFVGPRPTLPDYIDKYEDWELRRFDVKPGLTGLAQINGNIFLEFKEKSAYDIRYIEKMSLLTDFIIIIKTIAIVIFGEDKFIKKTKAQMKGEKLND